MLAHVFLPLILPAVTLGSSATGPGTVAAHAQDPPVRIWLDNDGRYVPGDEGRVEVRADRDGYLLVLQVDPLGNVRVLFPLDPQDDNFVRGGRKYELVGRGGRRTFYVENSTGTGTIYAAHSLSPFAFQDYVRNGHWDYQVLYLSSIGDVEGATTDLVGRMTSDGTFDYDVARYEVAEEASYAAAVAYPAYRIYDPYYGCFTCGRVYYGGSSFHVAIGFGDPWWYDPFYYYPTYPVYYGYNHFRPYYPYYAYRAHWYGYRPYHYPYPRGHYAGHPYRPDYQFKPRVGNSPRGGFDDGYRRRGIGIDAREVDYRVRTRPDARPRSGNPVLTSRPDRPGDRRTVDRPQGTTAGRRTTAGSPVARPTERGTTTRRRAEPSRPAPSPRAEPRRGDPKSTGGRRETPQKETSARPAPDRTRRPEASPPPRREAQPRPARRPIQRPDVGPPPRREAQPRSTGGRRATQAGSPWGTARPQGTPAPRRTPVLRAPSRTPTSPTRREVGRSTPPPSRASRPSSPRTSVGRATPSRKPIGRSGARRKP